MTESARAQTTPASARPARCPRCGARLGERAAEALERQRATEAAGRVPAVPDDAAFCGCCGLLFASA